MGARGQGRLSESSGSLNEESVWDCIMWLCEMVRNSIFWELRYEKHENQMKGCCVELRVSDLQMNAWTWRICAGYSFVHNVWPLVVWTSSIQLLQVGQWAGIIKWVVCNLCQLARQSLKDFSQWKSSLVIHTNTNSSCHNYVLTNEKYNFSMHYSLCNIKAISHKVSLYLGIYLLGGIRRVHYRYIRKILLALERERVDAYLMSVCTQIKTYLYMMKLLS